MKKLLFILLIQSQFVTAQTVIPQSTTVYDFGKMKRGFYKINAPGDTIYILKDSTSCPKAVEYYSILPQQKPKGATETDGKAITVGVKFRPAVAGFVTGVKFYKTKGNTGTHIGQLYSNNGTLLWSVPFASETDSGWQTVLFSQPVAVSASTTYIAAVFSPNGFYVSTNHGFDNAVSNGLVTALASGTNGVNGVYNYGTTPRFPTLTYLNSNYWTDIIYKPK